MLDRLSELCAESVHCVVTSPPYYGLRDYGIEPQVWGGHECEHEWGDEGKSEQRLRNGLGSDTAKVAFAETLHPSTGAFCRHCHAWRGSLGLEPSVELYLEHMVAVFREVRRVLRKDGTCWVNIGDSYGSRPDGSHGGWNGDDGLRRGIASRYANAGHGNKPSLGTKPKDLLMMPAQLALAMRADGWYLRSEIVWAKKAPMPESCTDRPTCAHEKVFLFAKSRKYFYDAEAVKEPYAREWGENNGGSWAHTEKQPAGSKAGHHSGAYPMPGLGANMRNVWHLGPEPFAQAHFATFPSELPRRCIMAGCPAGGTVLDPFFGAGTTGLVADQIQRDCIGIEISPSYAAMAEKRICDDAGMFAAVAAE